MNKSITIEELKKVNALRDLPDEHLQWILDRSVYEERKDGDVVVKTGEPIDEMFFFLEGKMDLA